MKPQMTVDQVVTRMHDQLPRWEAENDRRCVFLRCYLDETISVAKAIEDGRFHDGPWIHELLLRFAQLYFDALDAYEASQAHPPVWHWAFHLAGMRTTTVTEDLLLGINAHISRDLPMALRDSFYESGEEMTPEDVERRLADFLVVNELIKETAKVAEKDVLERYSHFMRVACVTCRPFIPPGRWAAERVIGSWREQAWESSLEMLKAESDATALAALVDGLETHAVARVHIVISASEHEANLLHMPRHELERLHLHHLHPAKCEEHSYVAAGLPDPAVVAAN